jgi:hypothetical protein
MSEHVKRGATKHEDRDTSYEWDGVEDGRINSIWCCTECDEPLEVKQRRGLDAYISLECGCGAASLDLRVADILEFEIDEWDTKTVRNLGRHE